MPLVRLETNEHLHADVQQRLCGELSRAAAAIIGKPETYVMVVVCDGRTMLHAGRPGPAAFVDVRSIGGLGPEVNRRLSESICRTLMAATKIPGDRVYLNFTDVPAGAWGHDGETFA